MGFVLNKSFITDAFVAAVYAKYIEASGIQPEDAYKSETSDRAIVAGYALDLVGLSNDFDLMPHVEAFKAKIPKRADIKLVVAHARAFFSVWTSRFLANTAPQPGNRRNVYLESITYCYEYDRGRAHNAVVRRPPILDMQMEGAIYNSLITDMHIEHFNNAEDFPVEVLAHAEMHSDEYDDLPWAEAIPGIEGHYARISKKFPGQVSYYESPERMKIGRRLCTKPGRYLTRFYPDMDPQVIRSWAAKTANFFKLQFADTGEDIEAVYRRGPDSCMSRNIDGYDGNIHPTRAYESPDLKLAYIGNDTKVSARALVWPEKKLVGRIYGDWDRLIPLLKEAGYKLRSETSPNDYYDTFKGARLKYIHHSEESVIFPYVDSTSTAYYDGEYMVLGSPPEDSDFDIYECQNDSGIAYCREKIYIADLEEYRTVTWTQRNAVYSSTFDEYVSDYEEVVIYLAPRYGSMTYETGNVGTHRENWYCDLDGHTYSESIEYTVYKDHKIPMQYKQWFIDHYDLDGKDTEEVNAA